MDAGLESLLARHGLGAYYSTEEWTAFLPALVTCDIRTIADLQAAGTAIREKTCFDDVPRMDKKKLRALCTMLRDGKDLANHTVHEYLTDYPAGQFSLAPKATRSGKPYQDETRIDFRFLEYRVNGRFE